MIVYWLTKEHSGVRIIFIVASVLKVCVYIYIYTSSETAWTRSFKVYSNKTEDWSSLCNVRSHLLGLSQIFILFICFSTIKWKIIIIYLLKTLSLIYHGPSINHAKQNFKIERICRPVGEWQNRLEDEVPPQYITCV